MRYPYFLDRFRDAIRNTWTVEVVDLHAGLARLTSAERPLVSRWWRSSLPATPSSPAASEPATE